MILGAERRDLIAAMAAGEGPSRAARPPPLPPACRRRRRRPRTPPLLRLHAAGNLPVKPNKYIEEWGVRREHIENEFR